NDDLNLIITNGGTGLGKKDLTIETIKPLFEKEISGFAALFQKLSYDEIGSACMLSRAMAGMINTFPRFA
ncbi:molybdopterin-binding protein, partial [bacterium]|nr:molybdopterin-binding protein [bacterium]